MKLKSVLILLVVVAAALLLIKTNEISGSVFQDQELVQRWHSDQPHILPGKPMPNRPVYAVSINPFTSSDVDILDEYFFQRQSVHQAEVNDVTRPGKQVRHRLDIVNSQVPASLDFLIHHWSTYATRTDINGNFSLPVPTGKYLVLVFASGEEPKSGMISIGQIEHGTIGLFIFQNSSVDFLVDPKRIN
jgi:hypothetical protein